MGVEDDVLTGMSGSRRLHPSEFMESLNDDDAMIVVWMLLLSLA